MPVATGTRLGPYEILAPLGAGGMGEVFRARDTRLGRDVAIKVLSADASENADRRVRFEKEARAASALNHPNIVSIFDIGTADGTTYIAMELVDGATLRESMPGGPVPTKRLLDIACAIADGLAKAHAAGIVHRDLKPENVMISKDGFVKILDFGLAKLVETPDENVSEIPTGTTPGMVMGTVGYMAPEQASGKKVDFRSDQFSLGTIFYEMASGKKAFRRDTSAETLVAIIRDEPEPLGPANPKLPPPLRWIIERCLSKDPEQRYASTRDLARDLAILREHLPEATSSGEFRAVSPETSSPAAVASFQRLSFQRGTILSARFAPDGRTVIYGASWDGNPTRLFSTRPESPESSALMLPHCEILAISGTGLMAVSLDRHWAGRFIWSGTLAQVSMLGGAPREVLEDVQWADWGPDGASLAAVRNVSGRHQIEYPIGRVLYQTAGWISHPRVSPDGRSVAFLDHPAQGNDAGSVRIVDAEGRVRVLSSDWITAYGLAWAHGGREIWFTATRTGVARAIWGVTLSGEERLLLRTPGELTIQDVSRDGGVLATSDNGKVGIVGLPPGQEKERDLSLLDWSRVCDLSPDGKTVLFDESGEGSGANGGVFIRRTDGSPAIRLGDGRAEEFSPDGKWVASLSLRGNASILPVKAGTSRTIEHPGLAVHAARWTPDGKKLLLLANEVNGGLRLFVHALDDSPPRPITPEGCAPGSLPVSADGKYVVVQGPDQVFSLYAIEGDEPPQPIPILTPDDRPIRWTPMGNSLYVFRRGELPAQIMRLDLATGRKERVLDLMPPDPAGVVEIVSVRLTPDAASYAYSYHRILSDLLLVEGLK
ncbi:MAG TPA: WD40 repeat domain-containing serine/threonine protein kinase [Thermoanaerobaculia bacterium]|nr:WD40 repeat domain-containing serine/threonine protein kinase [Thermoanaerobaculia bacterium]